MSQPARDLALVLRGRPVATSITVRVCGTWTFVRLAVANDNDLWTLAEELRLEPAGTTSRGRTWWRRATHKPGGVVVVTARLRSEDAAVDDRRFLGSEI